MKIVVLAGGTSTERAISIVSGTEVAAALQGRGHQVFLIDVFCGCSDEEAAGAFERECSIASVVRNMEENSKNIKELIKSRREFIGPNVIEICQKADIVFMALHGANGEDGKIQAVFDLFGIRYTGTDYLSSAIAMDKGLTKQFFRWNNVPTPKGSVIKKGDIDISYRQFDIELPVIVKPCCGGSSVGVTVAYTNEEYTEALKEAFYYEDKVIVEEYIEGREFSVAVIDNKPYPIVEIAPIKGFYNYENKYKAGSTVETCPARISDELTAKMQKMAVDGAKALGITGYCRLDFMMDENDDIYCLEANTLPGMTPTSLIPQEAAVLGISFPELCEKLLGLSR
jgi:D-alanine-D-alanine ligase